MCAGVSRDIYTDPSYRRTSREIDRALETQVNPNERAARLERTARDFDNELRSIEEAMRGDTDPSIIGADINDTIPTRVSGFNNHVHVVPMDLAAVAAFSKDVAIRLDAVRLAVKMLDRQTRGVGASSADITEALDLAVVAQQSRASANAAEDYLMARFGGLPSPEEMLAAIR